MLLFKAIKFTWMVQWQLAWSYWLFPHLQVIYRGTSAHTARLLLWKLNCATLWIFSRGRRSTEQAEDERKKEEVQDHLLCVQSETWGAGVCVVGIDEGNTDVREWIQQGRGSSWVKKRHILLLNKKLHWRVWTIRPTYNFWVLTMTRSSLCLVKVLSTGDTKGRISVPCGLGNLNNCQRRRLKDKKVFWSKKENSCRAAQRQTSLKKIITLINQQRWL